MSISKDHYRINILFFSILILLFGCATTSIRDGSVEITPWGQRVIPFSADSLIVLSNFQDYDSQTCIGYCDYQFLKQRGYRDIMLMVFRQYIDYHDKYLINVGYYTEVNKKPAELYPAEFTFTGTNKGKMYFKYFDLDNSPPDIHPAYIFFVYDAPDIRSTDVDLKHRLISDIELVGLIQDKPFIYAKLIEYLREGDVTSVNSMLDKGIDVNASLKDGMTALMFAAGNIGNFYLVDLLIKKGANVNAQANNGMTALIAAIGARDIVSAKILIRNGADINAKDEAGTALMYASTLGYVHFVKMLLENGAAQDSNSLSKAIDYAKLMGHTEIVTLLEDARPK